MLLKGWECEGAEGRARGREGGEKGQVRGSWAGKEGRGDWRGPGVATGEGPAGSFMHVPLWLVVCPPLSQMRKLRPRGS